MTALPRLRRRVGVGLAALLLSARCLGSADDRIADLLTVYERARTEDPTFQAAIATLEAARQKKPEAFSALLPSLAATGSRGETHGSTLYTGTPRVTRSFQAHDWALELRQPLFRATNLEAYAEAKLQVEQAVAQYAVAEQDLVLRVARAYFDVLIAHDVLDASEAQVHALAEQSAAAARSFKAGVGSITDQDDAESRLALAEAQREQARADLLGRRAALEALAGPIDTALAPMTADAMLPAPEPPDLSTWLTRAVAESPAVLAAEAAKGVAEHEIARNRAQRYPTVDLSANLGANYSSGNITNPFNYATDVRDKQLSLQVTVPLLDGGGIHAQVLEALANRHRATAELEAAKRQARIDTTTSYAALTGGLAQVRALRTAVAAGERAVKGSQASYRVGIRINSDVLIAEQHLFESRRDYARARYDTVYAGLKLKAVSGLLTRGDIASTNRLLESVGSGDTPSP